MKRFNKILNINKTNLNKIQEGPGVYGMYTRSNKLLKVGRAKRFRPTERILENTKEIAEAKKFGFISTESVKAAMESNNLTCQVVWPVLSALKSYYSTCPINPNNITG